METNEHRRLLVHVLHMAYSGEKAAAFAYDGHWRSLKNPDEQAAVKQIEQEEWDHRAIVGAMLKELGSKPQWLRDWWMGLVGKTIGASCFLIGWFLPMYFAGRLEHANVGEYAVAAAHAEEIGLDEFAAELRRLSVVELRHERFFYEAVAYHWLLPLFGSIFRWGPRFSNLPALSMPLDYSAAAAPQQ